MRQIELTSKLVLALIAAILVTALVTLAYQSQVANAAPMKKYQIYVTLRSVPANAEDLIMNATLFGPSSDAYRLSQTVSNPYEGETVKFVFKVPSGGNEDSFYICGRQAISSIDSCELYSFTGNDPIRVDFTYPIE